MNTVYAAFFLAFLGFYLVLFLVLPFSNRLTGGPGGVLTKRTTTTRKKCCT